MRRVLPALLIVVLLATGAAAGEFNQVLSVGDAAPAWVDLPGIDGKKHSLADLKDKPVVVVVFTCNSCSVAVAYEDRLLAFVEKHRAAGVAVVAINVNRVPEDRLDKMKQKAEEKKFTFPYLYDESQKIAKLFGATYTPEFFVLDRNRKVVYMGALDDQFPPNEPKVIYLDQAVAAALKGEKAATGETRARGCKVRYVRSK